MSYVWSRGKRGDGRGPGGAAVTREVRKDGDKRARASGHARGKKCKRLEAEHVQNKSQVAGRREDQGGRGQDASQHVLELGPAGPSANSRAC